MDDIFYIVSSCLIIAIIVVMSIYFTNVFTPMLSALSPNNTLEHNVTMTAITNTKTTLTQTFDSGFAIVFVLMFASSMILGLLLPTNPVFFLPFIFILAILMVITAIVSNMWEAYIGDAAFASAAAELVYIPFMMANLPAIVAIMGFALASVVYISYKRG
jgi:hypothetical protein